MLTSTLLGSEGNDAKLEVETQLNSQIDKIHAMILSFVKNVEHEIQLLKEIVKVPSTSRAVTEACMSSKTMNSLQRM